MTKSKGFGYNPVLPSDVYIPDGEPHVFGDRLYVYGSMDSAESNSYSSTFYHVVSTDDMMNWCVHDESFNITDVPWAYKKQKEKYYTVDMGLRNPTPQYRKLLREMHIPLGLIPKFLRPKSINFGAFVKKKMLFAPDCVEKDGEYYLYFCLSDFSEGVAVSDRPEGPFRSATRLPCNGIDPAVFLDDNGKVYYYWGQFRPSAVCLNEDMVSFDEKKVVSHVVTEEEHGFHEGSSMRKINGLYYYIYPCVFRNEKPTCLAYATSENPLGPFKYRGIIIDNSKCDPKSWNIHGSIQQFHGQWYVFYHRSSDNSRAHRRLCVEKITVQPDGTIDEVKPTSIGAGKPFAINERIEGVRACEVEGGAYISKNELIMCDKSSAIFRYAEWDCPVVAKLETEGNGTVKIYADGKTLEECGKGIHEIELKASGDIKIKSIVFGKKSK